MLNEEFRNALLLNETNLDEVLKRFSGNEDLYEEIITNFPFDTSIFELKDAIDKQDWDSAFTAAHALKGLAGNLGFTPLFHSIGELVIDIRTGRINEVSEAFKKAKYFYDDIVRIIKTYCKSKEIG